MFPWLGIAENLVRMSSETCSAADHLANAVMLSDAGPDSVR